MIVARGSVHSLQISRGGVPKLPIDGARIGTLGVEGDVQRMRKFHGGPERAVCLWSLEIIDALRREGHAVEAGAAGENITVRGLPWDAVVPGVQFAIGAEVLLEVASYAAPCKTIAHLFIDEDSTRISYKLHGAVSRVYTRVLREGFVAPGDGIELIAP